MGGSETESDVFPLLGLLYVRQFVFLSNDEDEEEEEEEVVCICVESVVSMRKSKSPPKSSLRFGLRGGDGGF